MPTIYKLYLQLHVRCCRLRGATGYRIASGTAGVLWPVNSTVLRLLCTVYAGATPPLVAPAAAQPLWLLHHGDMQLRGCRGHSGALSRLGH